ncbi:hypothetical protein BX600DRAFT_463986 [Xylariales sp. PMI_506]|nr:hypothetical protein BX600DRAFT_463986 [Xylariales sp. PMI_506]
MNAQRVGVTALRQIARQPNAAFFSHNLPRLALGLRAATNMQIRPVSTTKLTPAEGESHLAAQRRNRPVSPHLTIYDYAQTWFTSSIWTRITGGIFSGGLYVFASAYLVAPLLGWHLETASLVSAFGSLPEVVKGGFKFLVAWPFVFHAINGTKHLQLDATAKGFAKSAIKKSGWAIWSASLVTALGLVAFL